MTLRTITIASALTCVSIALLAIQVSIEASLRYVLRIEPGPEPVVANAFAHPFLVLHVIGAMPALLMGPAQFVGAIRRRWPAFHRGLGRAYVLSCIVGAPTGLVLAIGTTAGPVAGFGFAIPALLWPAFTALALRAAMRGRYRQHREWMLRSYAVLAGAITLRLMLPSALASGWDFYPAYRIISWLAWSSNLLVAEAIIRWGKRSAFAPDRREFRLAAKPIR